VFEGGISEEGLVTWRNALRLNESVSVGGKVRTGAERRDESGMDALDLVRPRGRAQENNPPLFGCLDWGAGREAACKSGLLIVS
jgi:hypothetical protein